jgi:hypothetical protein
MEPLATVSAMPDRIWHISHHNGDILWPQGPKGAYKSLVLKWADSYTQHLHSTILRGLEKFL